MKIIVLQHIACETPGYIKDLMIKDGFDLTTIELDEGERIPNDIEQFDGMFCMGGPMDTWMEKDYPWDHPYRTFHQTAQYHSVSSLPHPIQ
jgi:GMP synthase-like glutamine amidotransferase